MACFLTQAGFLILLRLAYLKKKKKKTSIFKLPNPWSLITTPKRTFPKAAEQGQDLVAKKEININQSKLIPPIKW